MSKDPLTGQHSLPATSSQHQDRFRTLPRHHHHQDRTRLILTASASGSGLAAAGGTGYSLAGGAGQSLGGGAGHGLPGHSVTGSSDTDYGVFMRTPSVRTLELLKEKRESIV